MKTGVVENEKEKSKFKIQSYRKKCSETHMKISSSNQLRILS